MPHTRKSVHIRLSRQQLLQSICLFDGNPGVLLTPSDGGVAADSGKCVDDRSRVLGPQFADLSVERRLTLVGYPGFDQHRHDVWVQPLMCGSRNIFGDQCRVQGIRQGSEDVTVVRDEPEESDPHGSRVTTSHKYKLP